MKTEETQADQLYQSFEKQITQLVETLAWNADGPERKKAVSMLSEIPLSIEKIKKQYIILLNSGKPEVRIVGSLDSYDEPETATFQVRTWKTDWQAAADQDENMLTIAARLLYFSQ